MLDLIRSRRFGFGGDDNSAGDDDWLGLGGDDDWLGFGGDDNSAGDDDWLGLGGDDDWFGWGSDDGDDDVADWIIGAFDYADDSTSGVFGYLFDMGTDYLLGPISSAYDCIDGIANPTNCNAWGTAGACLDTALSFTPARGVFSRKLMCTRTRTTCTAHVHDGDLNYVHHSARRGEKMTNSIF